MTFVKIGASQFEAIVQTRPADSAWDGRESKAVTFSATYADAAALFVNDAPWAVIVKDETGALVSETDMSVYSLAGSITDNRNGTVTAKMGKYKETELLTIPLSVPPKDHKEATAIRTAIETAAQSLDDQEALTAKALYPEWSELVKKSFTPEKAGFKFRHGGDLYKTIGEKTAFESQWIPGEGTESLFVRIDEAHAGTADDPIPYSGNMALENGLYYEQNGTVYRCTRDTINPVHNALADLVGIYVEIAA